TRVYGSFLLLVLLDSAATLFSINLLVSLDRSAFAFTFVVLSAAFLSFNIIYLVLEIIVLVALLDFSFLLRKLSDTKFERAILNRRLAFYGETLVPSFFLSYAVIYLYSFIPNSQSFAAPVFAISSVGAIFIILVMVRSLSSPSLLGRKQSSETGN
ncbi:MAG: hypothetical protein ACREBQ_14335, partial [Nitrososphaerales archaeon]